ANLAVSPYQFNPVTRELIFNKKLVVEITYNASAAAGFSKINDPATEQFVSKNLANASVAVNWIEKQSLPGISKKTDDDWHNPSKNYYKIYLKEEGLYRITYEYLVNAGVPVNSIPVENLELVNYGEYIPLYIKDLDSNNVFNEGDYFE